MTPAQRSRRAILACGGTIAAQYLTEIMAQQRQDWTLNRRPGRTSEWVRNDGRATVRLATDASHWYSTLTPGGRMDGEYGSTMAAMCMADIKLAQTCPGCDGYGDTGIEYPSGLPKVCGDCGGSGKVRDA